MRTEGKTGKNARRESLRGRLADRMPGETARRVARHTAAELAGAARAFEEVGRVLECAPKETAERGEAGAALRGAVETVCRPCPRKERCWGEEFETSRGRLTEALPEILRRGYAEAASLPEPFGKSCLRADALADALGENLAAERYRRSLRGAMEASRELLIAQYREFAAVLRREAERASVVPWFDARAERRLARLFREQGYPVAAAVWRDARGRVFAELSGAAADGLAAAEERTSAEVSRLLRTPMCFGERRDAEEPRILLRPRDRLRIAVSGVAAHAPGQSVCGDVTRFFRLRDGTAYLIFSDGMGHGEEARAESARVIDLLEQDLRGGLPAELALRVVTSAVLLRNRGTAFATVDLLEFDPYTGTARICKCGAAPSYLCRAGKVIRLAGAGLPVGTGIFPPELRTEKLLAGDCLLLLSDGITDGEEDGWLTELLHGAEEEDAGTLAGRVLSAAREGDDRTVLVLSVRAAE